MSPSTLAAQPRATTQAPKAAIEEKSAKRKPSQPRKRYAAWQREGVAREYPTARTPEEKLAICEKYDIPDIRRLYNLACQMGLTRGSEDLSDKEFHEYMAGNRGVMTQRRRFNPQDEEELLRRREDPRTTTFSSETDKFLIANFGRLAIPAIARQRGHSETAILYRARFLTRQERNAEGELMPPMPLRRPAIGYSLKRVLSWLGLGQQEVKALKQAGVEINPLLNKKQEVVDYWVMAETLAPFLRKYGALLIREKKADMFFVKEILETEEALRQAREANPQLWQLRAQVETAPNTEEKAKLLAKLEAQLLPLKQEGKVEESCYFLDHGHKCQNPWAGPCFQLFCDGEDPKCIVKEIRFEG